MDEGQESHAEDIATIGLHKWLVLKPCTQLQKMIWRQQFVSCFSN
ncbi:hypothetical protein MtrunA17_Chr1g0204961 [Medicago truncatula]|uniref:Uncharacterized protein n=1 Tax=Medicago truncatula TaxID=3880 RepID=A0A396JUI2_MEDTR|nr:hypothetical protein MtrunA17_Chr1g0204961 [Medicago truncatula]